MNSPWLSYRLPGSLAVAEGAVTLQVVFYFCFQGSQGHLMGAWAGQFVDTLYALRFLSCCVRVFIWCMLIHGVSP